MLNSLYNKKTEPVIHHIVSKKPRNIIISVVLIFLLVSSLLQHIKLPYIMFGIHNLLVPLFALILIALNLEQFKNAVRHNHHTLLFMFLFYMWMWISTLFSNFQSIAIMYSIKYTSHLIIFFSFLILTYKKQDKLSYYNLILRFLLLLALFGIIEYLFPHLWFFYPLGDESSNMYLRISSLMQGPNQFAILMSLGLLLTLILYKKKAVSALEFYFNTGLFIIVLSLAASKNGWLILLVGISLAWLYKTIKLRGAFFIVSLLLFFILFFPISTYHLGMGRNNIFPLQNLFAGQTKQFGSLGKWVSRKHIPLGLDFNCSVAKTNKPLPLLKKSRDAFEGQSLKVFATHIDNESSDKDSDKLAPSAERFSVLLEPLNVRILLWKAAIHEIIKSPIIGMGIQVFEKRVGMQIFKIDNYHTHNLLLNILVSTGVPGLLLAFLMVYSLLKKADFYSPIIGIPVIIIFSGQIFDFFFHDFTFIAIAFYFLAEAGNSNK